MGVTGSKKKRLLKRRERNRKSKEIHQHFEESRHDDSSSLATQSPLDTNQNTDLKDSKETQVKSDPTPEDRKTEDNTIEEEV